MGLHVTALDARVVLELALGCVERIAQRHVDVLGVLPVDHDLPARRCEVHAHRKVLALLLVAVLQLGHDAAAHQFRIEPVELLHPFANMLIERVGMFHAAHGDLQ